MSELALSLHATVGSLSAPVPLRVTTAPQAALLPPVVALVASAGGVEALYRVLAPLPADFPAAVIVVLHVSPRARGELSAVLARRTAMTVRNAEDGDLLTSRLVLVAPPGRHVLITPAGTICLIESGPQPPPRPSADLLLATLAMSCGSRVTAVILTGVGRDGTAGIRAVSYCGGTVLAQDQESSKHFDMPGSAINTKLVDQVVPLDRIADVLLDAIPAG